MHHLTLLCALAAILPAHLVLGQRRGHFGGGDFGGAGPGGQFGGGAPNTFITVASSAPAAAATGASPAAPASPAPAPSSGSSSSSSSSSGGVDASLIPPFRHHCGRLTQ